MANPTEATKIAAELRPLAVRARALRLEALGYLIDMAILEAEQAGGVHTQMERPPANDAGPPTLWGRMRVWWRQRA